MYSITENLLMFGVLFLFIFLLQYNFFMKPKIKRGNKNNGGKEKEKKIVEIEILSAKFNIEKKFLMNSLVGLQISLINAFIFSFTCTFVFNIPLGNIYQLLIAFVVLMILLYSYIELYGRYLLRKYNESNKH